MIKVVILDIDNTLLSFAGYVKQSMQEGFEHFGLKKYEDWMYPVFERINNELWKQLERGELTFEGLKSIRWSIILKELGIDFDGKVFEEYFRGKLFYSGILEAGAKQLLDYLKDKYTLCVASNGPYEQQLNRLRIGGIYDYFSNYFISSKLGSQKPTKEFFDCCFKELRESGFTDLMSEEVIIIGDSITADIVGGKNYGMQTCLYRCNKADQTPVPEADYIVNDLSEIENIL